MIPSLYVLFRWLPFVIPFRLSLLKFWRKELIDIFRQNVSVSSLEFRLSSAKNLNAREKCASSLCFHHVGEKSHGCHVTKEFTVESDMRRRGNGPRMISLEIHRGPMNERNGKKLKSQSKGEEKETSSRRFCCCCCCCCRCLDVQYTLETRSKKTKQ